MRRIATGDRRQETRKSIRFCLVACCLSLVAASKQAPPAGFSGFQPAGGHPVTAELITEHASIQPGGQTKVGVHFDLEEGWHIYAQEPGDAGLPTTITWNAPEEATIGPLQWPKPHEFLAAGDIHTFGYAGTVVLSSTMTLVQGTKSDAIPLRAKVAWLACKDICVPGSANLEMTLPVTANPPAFSTHAQFFEQIEE